MLLAVYEKGYKFRHVCYGYISLVKAIPWGLKPSEALSNAYRLPALQPGGADVLVETIADHHRLRGPTYGPRKSELENRRVRLLKARLRGGEADRDKRH